MVNAHLILLSVLAASTVAALPLQSSTNWGLEASHSVDGGNPLISRHGMKEKPPKRKKPKKKTHMKNPYHNNVKKPKPPKMPDYIKLPNNKPPKKSPNGPPNHGQWPNHGHYYDEGPWVGEA
jgi:hypothetical protein